MSAATGRAMRPDDAGAYRQALRLARQHTGAALTFGGQLSGGHLLLDEFFGTRTDRLDGLRVRPGRGIGGYVTQSLRPFAVNDYATATAITHDYDEQVCGEGIHAIAAAPVTVRGQVRGVLYAAVRSVHPLGDVAMDRLEGISRQLATELAIRDEVDRRVRLLETAALVPAPRGGLSRADFLDVRDELRSIAGQVSDPVLRERILRARDRLGRDPATGTQGPPAPPAPLSPLSPREIDVLAEIALGCTNTEVAGRLSLRPETVKSYLRSASRKLGVSGRYQAVLAARGLGLLDGAGLLDDAGWPDVTLRRG